MHTATSVDATCRGAIMLDFESDDGWSVTVDGSGSAADEKFQVSIRTRMRLGRVAQQNNFSLNPRDLHASYDRWSQQWPP